MKRMLKQHDLFVLISLSLWDVDAWTFDTLTERLALSRSQAHRALERAARSHLYDAATRRPRRAELVEFVVYGMRYAFATSPGASARGMPTGWRAPGLDGHVVEDRLESYVWPHPRGTARGRALEPLHDAVILTAGQDPRLHRALALCDVIRLGSARERMLAARLFEEELEA
jgi:hypothetical protein